MYEIIFEVREDEVYGGFVATAVGHAVATQGDTLEELREMARDAVLCHFSDEVPDRREPGSIDTRAARSLAKMREVLC